MRSRIERLAAFSPFSSSGGTPGGGGGGGSTGWTGTGWSNTVSIRNTDVSYSGSRRVAPEMANVDYPGESTPLVAYGADFGAFGGDGGPGYVVIRY